MQKLGFYFLTKDRDVIISCPCCKDYTRFEKPESNIESVKALMKATKDAFYLSYYSYSNTDDLFGSSSTGSATISTNGRIDSTNISNCTSIDSMSSNLRMPYGEPVSVICPKCEGESISYNYNPDYKHPTPFYVGSTVTEDYKRIQFNVKGLVFTFFKNKVQTHYYMTRIVFNKYTGRVTILRPLGTDNKPLRLFNEYSKMWNVTYGRFDARADLSFKNDKDVLLKDLKENLVPRILKGIQGRFPYIKDDHFDDCFIDHPKLPEPRAGSRIVRAREVNRVDFSYVFRNIVRKFRFHDLPTEFLDTFSNQHPQRMKVLSRVSYLSKQQHTDLIKIAGGKLPKSLRKSVLKNFNALLFVRDVKFIKSVSNLNKMIERYADGRFDPEDFEPFFNEYMHALMEKNSPNFNNEEKLYEHCETICVNRLTDIQGAHWIRDTYYQLNQIREQGEEYVINTDLTLRQLHDDVSSALRKIKTKNKELTYTEKEQEIEWNYGKYIFKLAHDTHYLVDVGATMNICVGGYGDSAHAKRLHIVTVSSPDNPYECCIEMTADMKTVRQAKTKHNSRPQDELLEAVMLWVNEKKLKIDTRDLPNEEIVEGEPNGLVLQEARPVAAAVRPMRLQRVGEVEEDDDAELDFWDAVPAVAE